MAEEVPVVLAIDVGNSQTVIGLFRGDELASHWRVSTDADLTGDELRAFVADLLALDHLTWSDIDHAIIASVVPRLTSSWVEAVEAAVGERPLVVGPGLKTELPIRYDAPHEVGADRIVNAVAAVHVFGAPVVIVDFGTATTLDVVSADGAYIGGAIAPGVETSAEALFSAAARLSVVDLEPPDRVIGSNTRESVQAGLLLGEAAMVDGLVRRVWEELGVQTPVVATGGLAERMAAHCETIGHVDVDLTLRGLLLVFERNAR
jgi:type III pantothenate kinase